MDDVVVVVVVSLVIGEILLGSELLVGWMLWLFRLDAVDDDERRRDRC